MRAWVIWGIAGCACCQIPFFSGVERIDSAIEGLRIFEIHLKKENAFRRQKIKELEMMIKEGKCQK